MTTDQQTMNCAFPSASRVVLEDEVNQGTALECQKWEGR